MYLCFFHSFVYPHRVKNVGKSELYGIVIISYDI